jgi:hypothetical protein
LFIERGVGRGGLIAERDGLRADAAESENNGGGSKQKHRAHDRSSFRMCLPDIEPWFDR